MIALLKWTSLAFAGAIGSTFLFVLSVIFAVEIAPRGMQEWQIVALIALTLYLWLFVLIALVRVLMIRPWGGSATRWRWPVAMY